MRGSAHIGVLRVLDASGYEVAGIAGTSIGGLVGALYLAGVAPDTMEGISSGFDRKRLFKRGPEAKNSLLGLKGLTEVLEEQLGDKRFEDLAKPLAVTAVDLHTGHEIILRQGRIVDAVLATIAFPGIFPSRTYGNFELTDGAVANPVPVAVARSLATELPVVAVPLSGKPNSERLMVGGFNTDGGVPGYLRPLTRLRWAQAFIVHLRASTIARRQLDRVRMELEKPDLLVYPDVGHVSTTGASDGKALIAAGEAAMNAALPELDKIVNVS
jgi:NTE family protein